jgi:hypothetical protein
MSRRKVVGDVKDLSEGNLKRRRYNIAYADEYDKLYGRHDREYVEWANRQNWYTRTSLASGPGSPYCSNCGEKVTKKEIAANKSNCCGAKVAVPK